MLKNKLKSWRHRLEMNQKEFAEFLGVSQGQVSRWESQEYLPNIESLWKIHKKLNCHIEELLEEEVEN